MLRFMIPREKPHTGAAARENPPSSRDWGLLFLPDLEINPWSFLQTSQEALLPLGHSMGSKRYLSRLERRAEYFVSPREEALPRVSLECNPEIPVVPGEEHYVLDTQLGKEYVKAVYCHPAYLTSMQSTLFPLEKRPYLG